jgi:NAD(P)-dependent dehydrogenase (short-subunit alcohol dehydrogenase family)
MKMQDKTILITGATSGIGYETALGLAAAGAHLVLTTRDLIKGNTIRKTIIDKTGNSKIDLIECNLDDLSSVRKAAGEYKQRFNKLHILINNAGIWETKRKESKNGIELTFAVNHLAPFLLTNLLLDHIKASAPARIINLASAAHKMGSIHFDDIEGKKSCSSMKSYGQSKLCSILFTKKLSEMLKGNNVTVNCLHPGVVATHLFDKMPAWLLIPFKWIFISPVKGAETSIYLATSDEVNNISGQYFAKKKVISSNKESCDLLIAEKLWDLSIEYTKII